MLFVPSFFALFLCCLLAKKLIPIFSQSASEPLTLLIPKLDSCKSPKGLFTDLYGIEPGSRLSNALRRELLEPTDEFNFELAQ